MSVLIKGGTIITAEQTIRSDVYCEDGKIAAIGENLDDANKAGGKEAGKCTLMITEGLSAKTFAVRGTSCITKGRDYYGAFAIRGKFLNVTTNGLEKSRVWNCGRCPLS